VNVAVEVDIRALEMRCFKKIKFCAFGIILLGNTFKSIVSVKFSNENSKVSMDEKVHHAEVNSFHFLFKFCPHRGGKPRVSLSQSMIEFWQKGKFHPFSGAQRETLELPFLEKKNTLTALC
jgi:hypothetical protein